VTYTIHTRQVEDVGQLWFTLALTRIPSHNIIDVHAATILIERHCAMVICMHSILKDTTASSMELTVCFIVECTAAMNPQLLVPVSLNTFDCSTADTSKDTVDGALHDIAVGMRLLSGHGASPFPAHALHWVESIYFCSNLLSERCLIACAGILFSLVQGSSANRYRRPLERCAKGQRAPMLASVLAQRAGALWPPCAQEAPNRPHDASLASGVAALERHARSAGAVGVKC
jgi:hypothetical protein